MEIFKAIFFKIGHMFLGTLGVFRRALCCFRRRRRMSDFSLPMTNNDLPSCPTSLANSGLELQSWESWNEGDQPSELSIIIDETRRPSRTNSDRQSFSKDEDQEEDFFKEMTPAIKKPKTLLVKSKRKDIQTSQINAKSMNGRFDVDLKAPLSHMGAELGTIDDTVSSWEDSAASEELWDTDNALKEHRISERERRLAEHQRKKYEKEMQRLGRNDNLPIAMRLS